MGDIFETFSDDTEPKKTRKESRRRAQKRKKKSRRGAAIVVLLLALLIGLGFALVPQVKSWFSESSPISSLFGDEGPEDYTEADQSEPITVNIPDGSTGADMARILEESDVVASAQAFVDAFNADPGAGAIQPGAYELPTKIPATLAVDLLKDHENQRVDVAITIPEGFTKQQVHERVANVMNIPIEDVEAAAADTAAIGLPEAAGGNPEGWYQPGTERFSPDATATDILSTFVANRVSSLEALGVPEDQQQVVLTKASILEREVNQVQYYGQVARVIENRLTDQTQVYGLLQMDSTVLYGVGKSGGIPTRDDLANDNPYNTYIHAGLPPTPIGASGDGAIAAVLNPAEGPWLYFVTVNLETGETLFTDNLEEHDQLVEQLRQWVADNPDYGN